MPNASFRRYLMNQAKLGDVLSISQGRSSMGYMDKYGSNFDFDTGTVADDWSEQSADVIANGQVQVTIGSLAWRRVFRANNSGDTDMQGDVYIAKSASLSAGVPITASTIMAKVDVTAQQTLMAIYTIPLGKQGFLVDWDVAMLSDTPATTKANVALKVRKEGGVFLTKNVVGLNSDSKPDHQNSFTVPRVYAEKTDIKIKLESTDKNNTAVRGGFNVILADVP